MSDETTAIVKDLTGIVANLSSHNEYLVAKVERLESQIDALIARNKEISESPQGTAT